MATAQRDIQISELFRSIGGRLRETNWAVSFLAPNQGTDIE
jgi:hypothetical protein